MKRRHECHHDLPHERDELFAELSRPVGAPDLTRSIMGRLGYMRVDPAVARRRRIHRWAGRSAVLIMMALTIAGGITVFNQSEAVRRPYDMTIPSAIGQDVEQHQQRVNTLIRVLQSSTPRHEIPHLSPDAPVSTDKPDETLPMIEFWRQDFGEDGLSDQPAHEAIDDEQTDEVEHPAIAPVRWA